MLFGYEQIFVHCHLNGTSDVPTGVILAVSFSGGSPDTEQEIRRDMNVTGENTYEFNFSVRQLSSFFPTRSESSRGLPRKLDGAIRRGSYPNSLGVAMNRIVMIIKREIFWYEVDNSTVKTDALDFFAFFDERWLWVMPWRGMKKAYNSPDISRLLVLDRLSEREISALKKGASIRLQGAPSLGGIIEFKIGRSDSHHHLQESHLSFKAQVLPGGSVGPYHTNMK